MLIAFPPCTYLTATGNRHFSLRVTPAEKVVERMKKREAAAIFFMRFALANCPRIAIENPVGHMTSAYRKPDQIVQPYLFGDPYEKRTCLWLFNLPPLRPTHIVTPEPRQVTPSGKTMPAWYNKRTSRGDICRSRQEARSKTFPGIARAMAEQWAGKVENE